MNDFDFEELDKAVNDLATKTHDEHGGTDPVETPSTPVVVKPAVVRPDDGTPTPTPTSSTPVEPIKPTLSPTPAVDLPKHTRLSDTRPMSRGSFMDIVTPSTRKPGPR